jgi:hypothetical protein
MRDLPLRLSYQAVKMVDSLNFDKVAAPLRAHALRLIQRKSGLFRT